MDWNVGCYKIEAKVLLTISNASLSSGNRKFTNDPVGGFFHSFTVYLKIDLLNTSIREL